MNGDVRVPTGMTHSKTALIALVLAACTDGSSGNGAISPADTARFQQHLDSLHAGGIVGVVGAFDDRGTRFEAHSGVAQLGGDQPVPLDAHFRIGSTTKTFVAVVVLQLVHEGVIGLDDTVDRWLPGLVSGNGNDGTHITIRQLLQHTSGLYNYLRDLLPAFSPDSFAQLRLKHYEPEDLVAIALQHPPRFAPGTSWSYSNTNYTLAGMIIEQATGHDWGAEVDTRILKPLGMSNTSQPADELDLPAPHANGYVQFGEGVPLLDTTDLNHSVAGAAGALISTTSDLLRFWRALQAGELLGAAEMTEMHHTVPVNDDGDVRPGSSYGLGIIRYPMSCGGGYWSHEGDTLGFSSLNAVSEDGSRAAQAFLTTIPGGPAVDAENVQLLDDVMCAGH